MAHTGNASVVIVQHDFNTGTGASTMGSMVQSSDFFASTGNTEIGDDGWGQVLMAYPTAGSTSASLALSNDSFWSLTVTAAAGQTLDIGSIFYSVGKGGSSDPRGYFIRSSVDSFASDIAGSQLPTGANQNPGDFSVSLAGNPAYQGLNSVTFRFYNYTPNPGFNSVDWRNVGLIAVPEPSDYALVFGAGSLGAVIWNRRRRASK